MIEPMSPGRREPSFWPIALRPCPTALVPAFKTVQTGKGKSAKNKTDGKNHSLQGPAVFLEDIFNPFE